MGATIGGAPEFHRGVRVAWLTETAARRCGVGAGELAEAFAVHHPAPLRFSVGLRPGLQEDAIELDQEAWRDLGLEQGARLLVRDLWSPDC